MSVDYRFRRILMSRDVKMLLLMWIFAISRMGRYHILSFAKSFYMAKSSSFPQSKLEHKKRFSCCRILKYLSFIPPEQIRDNVQGQSGKERTRDFALGVSCKHASAHFTSSQSVTNMQPCQPYLYPSQHPNIIKVGSLLKCPETIYFHERTWIFARKCAIKHKRVLTLPSLHIILQWISINHQSSILCEIHVRVKNHLTIQQL